MKRPLIIGLTGGIGMGKSTAAALLAAMGLPVHSADAAVHRLLSRNGAAVKRVAKLFPDALKRGAIDRATLGAEVFGRPRRLKALEDILHPLVRKDEIAFVRAARAAKKPAVVLEIPLLFETGAEARCDVVICVTAPRAAQKKRVLARPGMTEARFRAILKAQMSDAERRRRADYVVTTVVSRADTKRQLKNILQRNPEP